MRNNLLANHSLAEAPSAQPMKQKIIFLDWDGVVRTCRSVYASGGVDRTTLQFLERLHEQAGVQYVLISERRRTAAGIKAIWRSLDASYFHREPTISMANLPRARLIQYWLAANAPDAEYMILDDVNNGYLTPTSRAMEWMEIDPSEGLSAWNTQQLLQWADMPVPEFPIQPVLQDTNESDL